MRIAILAAASLSLAASASPLEMTYTMEDIGGGLYNYEFTLTMTNVDGSWSPGQGFGWIIWGDQRAAPSPMGDFVGDPNDLPVGPFQGYCSSSGFHNGPTFCVGGGDPFQFFYWQPNAVGESLQWSGTSAAVLGQGEMLFSNLIGINGAVNAEFLVATLEEGDDCPADFDGDGFVTGLDFDAYVAAFEAGDISADFDGDGFVTGLDFDGYVADFEFGCD